MSSVEIDHLEDNDTLFQLSPSYQEKEKIIRHIKNVEIKYTSSITLRKQKIESMRICGLIERKEEPQKHDLKQLDIKNGNIKNEERETTNVDNVNSVRRRPTVKLKSIIRYQMCKHFIRHGRCDRGDQCIFAHSDNELDIWNMQLKKKRETIEMPTKIKHILAPRLTPPVIMNGTTKYKMCKSLHKSKFCSYADKCKYAHSSEELLLWRALQGKGFFDNINTSSNEDGTNIQWQFTLEKDERLKQDIKKQISTHSKHKIKRREETAQMSNIRENNHRQKVFQYQHYSIQQKHQLQQQQQYVTQMMCLNTNDSMKHLPYVQPMLPQPSSHITDPSQRVQQPVFMPGNMPVVSQQQHRQLYIKQEHYNDVSLLLQDPYVSGTYIS